MDAHMAKTFAAGAASVLLCHQTTLGVLTGFSRRVYMPTRPNAIGVPMWASLPFFGGLWALVMEQAVGLESAAMCGLFGGLVVHTVAMLVVFPLKLGRIGNMKEWIGGLMANTAWGVGVPIFASLLGAYF